MGNLARMQKKFNKVRDDARFVAMAPDVYQEYVMMLSGFYGRKPEGDEVMFNGLNCWPEEHRDKGTYCFLSSRCDDMITGKWEGVDD